MVIICVQRNVDSLPCFFYNELDAFPSALACMCTRQTPQHLAKPDYNRNMPMKTSATSLRLRFRRRIASHFCTLVVQALVMKVLPADAPTQPTLPDVQALILDPVVPIPVRVLEAKLIVKS